MTTEEIRQRAIDLRKVYGVKGVSVLLNVDPSIVNAVLSTSDDRAVSRVKGSVRHYWKPWMRGLTNGSPVAIVKSTKVEEKVK
jgi:hypothetical protein